MFRSSSTISGLIPGDRLYPQEMRRVEELVFFWIAPGEQFWRVLLLEVGFV